jgi:hypothetical protein
MKLISIGYFQLVKKYLSDSLMPLVMNFSDNSPGCNSSFSEVLIH